MVVPYFVGADGVNPLRLTGFETVLMFVFFISWLGLLVAWRWEVLGGAMTLGGMISFHLLHYLGGGRGPQGWAFACLAFPGVLFLCCGLWDWLTRLRLGN